MTESGAELEFRTRYVIMLSPRALSLAITAVTLALAYGIWYSYSVILVALLQEYGWSRSVLAGAFSVFTLVHGGVNPLIGALCDRLRPLVLMAGGGAALGIALFIDSFIASPWHLYAAFGFLTAVTVAAAGWVPSLVQVQRDFKEKLGLAVGLLSSGVGIGMTFVVPLTQFLIDAYGWRTAFRVLAVICVLWIVPSSLYLLRLRNRGQSPINSAPADAAADSRPRARKPLYNATLKEASRHEPFWLMLGAFFFGNVCSQTLHVHQVAYLVDQGVTATVAATVVGLVGASSIVGKISGGWLADRFPRELVYIVGISIMLASIAALAAIGPHPAAWAIYGYAILLGVGYSATASITPAMISDRFGGPSFGTIIGVLLVGSSAGSAVGPWMAGFIFDRTSSYMLAFAIAAACGIVTAAAGWRAWVLRLRA
jgi:MFS family permease